MQLNLNDVHATLSAPLRFAIAVAIFLCALALRFEISPIEAGVKFVTFYPAVFLSFYLCGAKPGFLVTFLSALCAFYIFMPPYWTLHISSNNITELIFFLISASFMGYVVIKGQYWHKRLLDIEHHKLEEIDQQLLTANKLLTMAEHSVSAGAWRWNSDTDQMIWSEHLFKLFGLDPSKHEAGFETWRQIVHPDDLQKAEDLIREARQNLSAFVIFYRIILPTGSIRWIDTYGGPIYDRLGKLIEFSGICINSTSLHLAEKQLQESELRFRNMFTNLTVGYQSLNASGDWIDANHKMADILGYSSPTAMIGQHFIDCWADNDEPFDTFYSKFKQNNFVDGEYLLKRCDGQTIAVIISGRIQRSREGEFICAHSVIIDISERRKMEHKIMEMNAELELKIAARTAELSKANDELLHLSRHDALTGLGNRLSANERLRAEFLSLKRLHNSYALLMLDIDFFKRVNDTFGHAVGDAVLQKLAQILKDTLRESDFAARYGGEEFLLLLPNTELPAARLVAEKLRQTIESSPHPVAGTFTVSIGVAIATADQADEFVAVKDADDCLYAAKHAGRNCIMSTGIAT